MKNCRIIVAIFLLLAILITPAYAYEELAKGSKGEEVVALQERLNELGYDVGIADGDFGNKTYNSVCSFQQDNDLEATGVVDAELHVLIFSATAKTKAEVEALKNTPEGFQPTVQSTVIDEVSEVLATSCNSTGSVSLFSAYTDGKVEILNNGMVAIVWPDGGYILEYKDENGEYHSWISLDKNFTDSSAEMITTIGTCYDYGYIDNGYFLVNGSRACVMICPVASPQDRMYDNVDAFTKACISVVILYD